MTEKEKKEILKRVGEKIKKLRNEKDWSLLEADYKSTFNESNLSKYEHGKKDLQISTLFKIAKLLETHPKNLLDIGIDYTSSEK